MTGKPDAGSGSEGRAPAESCPICGKPAQAGTLPFCSKRCANVDLNRWLTGAYAIPAAEDEDEDGGPPSDSSDA